MANQTLPDWLRDEVVSGLQKLYCLRLNNTPPEDAIEATALVWLETLAGAAIVWQDGLDQQRVKQAFVQLLAKCHSWPAPCHFFEYLGQRPPQVALPAPSLSPEKRRARLAEIRQMTQQLKQVKKLGD